MFLRLGRLLRLVGRDVVVLWYACRDPATPLYLKLLACLLGLYLVSPLDVIPDWLVIFGLTDDLALLALGIPALLKLLPELVLRRARAAADQLLSRLRLGRS